MLGIKFLPYSKADYGQNIINKILYFASSSFAPGRGVARVSTKSLCAYGRAGGSPVL